MACPDVLLMVLMKKEERAWAKNEGIIYCCRDLCECASESSCYVLRVLFCMN